MRRLLTIRAIRNTRISGFSARVQRLYDFPMVNGNGTGDPEKNGVVSIYFERMPDGSWTASTDTANGEIAGNGSTILKARHAFDDALRIASQKRP